MKQQDLPFPNPNVDSTNADDFLMPSTFYFAQESDHRIPREFSPFLNPYSPASSMVELNTAVAKLPSKYAPSSAPDSPLSMAIQHFLAALTFDDEHLPARTWLGRCYWQQGRYELARVELERATKGGRIRGRKVWAAWYVVGGFVFGIIIIDSCYHLPSITTTMFAPSNE